MNHRAAIAGLVLLMSVSYGCSPTVKVATPEKPITINLNVKIKHEILVKVDKELDNVLSEDSGLF
ncbi:MAG: YnbE family lipoprotein [Desulfobulbus sp.]|nr:MAG: YnbE family lipoprotein [Desulfobulbus sp.]